MNKQNKNLVIVSVKNQDDGEEIRQILREAQLKGQLEGYEFIIKSNKIELETLEEKIIERARQLAKEIIQECCKKNV